jgi:hypothetical protein
MPTLIDSLIVSLDLDPKNFTKGQKEAADSFLKTGEEAKKTAQQIEKSAKDASQFIAKLRNEVIGLFAAFTAGKGLKEFVGDITSSDAATGRFAKTLDMTVRDLSKWQGVAKLVGGSAEGITGSMQGLTQQLQQFSLTGETSVIPYFRALGISIVDQNGRIKTAGDLYLQLADAFSKMDPARAATFGSALGMDQGTINVLIQGRAAVEAMLKEQDKLGVVNEKNAKASVALQKAWGQLVQSSATLGRELLTSLAPALIRVIDGLTRLAVWAQDHPTLVSAVFFTLAAAVTAFSVALSVGFASSLISTVVSGITLITGAVWGLSAALAATPIGLLLGAVAGLGYIGYQTYLNRDKLGTAPANGGQGAQFSAGSPQARMQAQADKQRLVEMGWSREQATGILANIQRESGGRANAVGDGGNAFGLAQWHPDRQAAFKARFGHDIRQSTREEQLAFINHELRYGSEKKAGAALMQATNAGDAARIVSNLYERPADQAGEASARAAIANAMTRAPAGAAGLARSAGIASKVANDNRSSSNVTTNETTIGAITVNTKATDAQGIANDIGPAMKRTSFAAQANYGLQ